ncbi:MAG TPA: YraN family protein [Bacillota bacterium]|nr:YraN family protein [Candidatus Fermentithermobacillaceae bacterium]HOB31202.1 YraN family protein [Bacillota bacterium]HOK63892.1 YraN family protein [Bacillota bacterium]HOL11420.1 YraN family protein [Bacillota bacterium]HOQ03150.1 YraN family protein [Bacillota bacterium]
MAGRARGFEAENAACEYLKTQGYHIMQRNFTSRYGEIDIIAYDEDILAFIEVRYRKNGGLVTPEESVSHDKIRRIKLTVRDYLGRFSTKWLTYAGIRIDLCAVTDNSSAGGFDFELLKGIVQF